LALTSPTGGGRSVGIVRSRTKATEFSLVLVCQWVKMLNVKQWRSISKGKNKWNVAGNVRYCRDT